MISSRRVTLYQYLLNSWQPRIETNICHRPKTEGAVWRMVVGVALVRGVEKWTDASKRVLQTLPPLLPRHRPSTLVY